MDYVIKILSTQSKWIPKNAYMKVLDLMLIYYLYNLTKSTSCNDNLAIAIARKSITLLAFKSGTSSPEDIARDDEP